MALIVGFELLQRCLRARLCRLGLLQPHPVGLGLDDEQDRALGDQRTVLVFDVLDIACNARHQIGLVDGGSRPGGFQIGRDLPLLGQRHRHLGRRRSDIVVAVVAAAKHAGGGQCQSEHGCGPDQTGHGCSRACCRSFFDGRSTLGKPVLAVPSVPHRLINDVLSLATALSSRHGMMSAGSTPDRQRARRDGNMPRGNWRSDDACQQRWPGDACAGFDAEGGQRGTDAGARGGNRLLGRNPAGDLKLRGNAPSPRGGFEKIWRGDARHVRIYTTHTPPRSAKSPADGG